MNKTTQKNINEFCFVTDYVANGSFASLKKNVKYLNTPDYAVLVRLTDSTKNWNGKYVYVSKSSYDFLSKSSLVPGDLIMSNVGEPGKVFIVPNLLQPMTLGPNSILIRPDNTVNTRYLYYYFLSSTGRSQIESICSATAQKKFNKTSFRKISLPIPKVSEQTRIVEILDEVCLVQKKRQESIALVNEYINSVFNRMFGDLSVNPNNYDVKTIVDLATDEKNSIKAGPFGSSLKKECYVESGYKIYGQEQVIRNDFNYGDYYIDEIKYKSLESCKIQKGDILISLVGTFGKISVVPDKFEPGIINPRLMKITPNQSIIYPIFLKELLVSDIVQKQIKSMSHGGTMSIVNVGIMKKITVLVPTLEGQKNYLEFKEKAELIKNSMQSQLQALDNQFHAITQKTFSRSL